MSDVVRLGVVGVGSVAIRGILPHLTQDDVDAADLTAVCDIDADRAAAAAEKFGADHAFEDYETMLDSGTVDAVSIATPIGLHYEQGMQAIERGVHVHFNKSFCTTLAEADDLVETAREEGVELVASPGQMIRPNHQRARSLVDDGAIGTPTWATSGRALGTYHIDSDRETRVRGGDDPLSNVDPTWHYSGGGGGPLYALSVYSLHSLTGILGPAERVTALSGVRIPEREYRGETIETGADDNSFLLVDFGDALTGFVYGASFGNLPGFRGFLVCGTEGRVDAEEINGAPLGVEGSSGLPHVTGPHTDIEEPHVFEDVMQLVDLVRDGTPTLATPEHARHVVEIIEKAYRSADDGRTKELETTFDLDENLMPHY